jgi:hypothetical protein
VRPPSAGAVPCTRRAERGVGRSGASLYFLAAVLTSRVVKNSLVAAWSDTSSVRLAPRRRDRSGAGSPSPPCVTTSARAERAAASAEVARAPGVDRADVSPLLHGSGVHTAGNGGASTTSGGPGGCVRKGERAYIGGEEK